MRIVCLKGLQGCGKDTFATLAQKSTYNTKRLSIADGIRQIVWKKYGVKIKDKNYLYGDYEQKEKTIDPFWLVSKIAAEHLNVPRDTPWTGRMLLQFEGTVSGTDIFEDVWTEVLRASVEDSAKENVDFLIVTDTRRPSQFEFFKQFKKHRAIVVEIIRTNDDNLDFLDKKDNHETEKLSASYPADVQVHNTFLSDYEETINAFLKEFSC